MALVHTTLSAACAASDTSIVVTLATGFSAGYLVRIGDEQMRITSAYVSGTTIPVIRGQEGTAVVAHAVTTGVVCGIASDWATVVGAQTAVQYPLAGKARRISTYGAAGAIALPTAGTDEVAVINGTSALAMTLAAPSKDIDSTVLFIIGDGKAAHTVTAAGGFGAGSTGYTVGTFDTNAQCGITLMAMNSVWVPISSPLSGTLTGMDVAIS
jgi:hypothetical protein